MKKVLPSQDELNALFRYDPETGVIEWRIPRSYQQSRSTNGSCGYLTRRNKIVLYVNESYYLAHRIIWKMVTGRDPHDQIDHINGDQSDNRIVNLREATHSQNGKNRGKHSNNTSGVPGVHYDKARHKWRAFINLDGRRVNVGRFVDKQMAILARKCAETKYFGEFARDSR